MPYERAAGGYMAARKASKKVINFFVVGLTYGWRKLGEKERQKAKEEQQKIKRMSMTILKAFFDDPAEYDMELIKSVIDSTDDTNRIVSWTDATENCSDKTALYNEIIGK